MNRNLGYLLALAACAAVTSESVQAQATYTYTSGSYNVFEQTSPSFEYNSNQHLTFSVTVGVAIAPNTGTDFNLLPVTWQASDGFHPVFGGTGQVNLFEPDDYNPPFPTILSNLYLHADSNGDIDSWYFNAFDVPFAGGVVSTSPNPPYADVVNTIFVSDFAYSRPTSVGVGDIAKAGVTESGTWTEETAAPEPATLTLVATGLITLGVSVRRRKRAT